MTRIPLCLTLALLALACAPPSEAAPVVFSTFLSGAGSDDAVDITIDASHNSYVTGNTWSAGLAYPPGKPLLQSALAGSDDAFVAKYDENGSLVFFTYLGGDGGYGDRGKSIALAPSGRIYLAGAMGSVPAAVSGRYADHFNQPGNNIDGFVASMSADAATLTNFEFLGGTVNEHALALALAPNGDVYVCGWTSSRDFGPVNIHATSDTCKWCGKDPNAPADYGDAFIVRLDANLTPLAWIYLGGDTGPTIAQGIAVDQNGDVYVNGITAASGLADHGQTTLGGSYDAFVARFSPSLATRQFLTYLGGSNEESGDERHDKPFSIALDASAIYIAGESKSPDFPTKNALPGTGSVGAFVAKFSKTGDLLFSSCLDKPSLTPNGRGRGIAVGSNGDVLVCGRKDLPSNPDVFVKKLRPTGPDQYDLDYSVFLGGKALEEAAAVAVDEIGQAYAAGFTESSNFPHKGAWQKKPGGGRDGFLTKIGK